MDQNGEDRITNLHESAVSHILSRLPTEDAVRTSILSKSWKYKWMSIYKIDLDDRRMSSRGKRKIHTFSNFLLRVLHFTQNSTIKSFCLSSIVKLDSQYLKRCIDSVLLRGVQNFEINTNRCGGNIFVDSLFTCRSLTKLTLYSECTLSNSLVKNGISNLKFLCLGYGVQLLNDDISNNVDVSLNFPILEELELKYCKWLDVKIVEINAPALIRLLAFSNVYSSEHYVIKINGPKLEKFLSSGTCPYHFALSLPLVSNVVLTNDYGGAALGFRAREILKGVPSLKYLKLSSEVVEALGVSDTLFPMLCFNLLKHLKLSNNTASEERLVKLVQSMPSLESLSLCMYIPEYEKSYGLRSLPVGIASRLKVVQLGYFGGLEAQMHLAESVLKNAENLDKLFVSVRHGALIPTNRIKQLLSTYPKSSHHASIEVIGPRHRAQT